MTHAYTIVDVFTGVALEGNPLAVFDSADAIHELEMQRLARELNLSETVFALAPSGGGDHRLRIFTPASELPFAGHPILGAAFALAGQRDVVTFETGAGEVPVALERAGGRVVLGRMSQPLPTIQDFNRVSELLTALGAARAELPIEAYTNGPTTLYVALEDELAVAALSPNMSALRAFHANVCCFAPASGRWKARVFGPAYGVDEDPATGSAAGPLAAHLCRHHVISFGEEIEIRQGAEIGRPSVLYARAEGGTDGLARIEVAGGAVIVGRGEFAY